MSKAFPWMSGFLGTAFGSLILSAVGVIKPSQLISIFAVTCVGIALVAWWVIYFRFRNDSPVSLEEGDKPEFILWKGGLYQRTGERVNNPTSKTEEQGAKQ